MFYHALFSNSIRMWNLYLRSIHRDLFLHSHDTLVNEEVGIDFLGGERVKLKSLLIYYLRFLISRILWSKLLLDINWWVKKKIVPFAKRSQFCCCNLLFFLFKTGVDYCKCRCQFIADFPRKIYSNSSFSVILIFSWQITEIGGDLSSLVKRNQMEFI